MISLKTLSIPFRGQAGNTGTFYVKVNGVKVAYPRDAANLSKAVDDDVSITDSTGPKISSS